MSAVGLPHPSDALTASAGSPPVSLSEYSFELIGSPHPQLTGPQQPSPALLFTTDRAIAPYFSLTASRISDMGPLLVFAKTNICKCYRSVIHLSRRIYDRVPARDGEPVQGAGRRHPAAHRRVAADRRNLRLPHSRKPPDPAVQGVAPPGLPAKGGAGRDAQTGHVGPLPDGRAARPDSRRGDRRRPPCARAQRHDPPRRRAPAKEDRL